MSAKELTDAEFNARTEAIAVQIEEMQANAFMCIAERIAKAHEMFLYRRDEGGFMGWVERRLKMSRSTAYRLLDINKQFGDESVSPLGHLSLSVLSLLAPDSVPEEARKEVVERAEAGEKITTGEAKNVIERHKPKKSENKPPQGASSPARKPAVCAPLSPGQPPVEHQQSLPAARSPVA